MTTPLATVLSLFAALPQDPQAAQPQPLDVIVLQNGEQFEGRVLTELDEYVEFELEQGSVVGVGRAQIREIRRGAGAVPAQVQAIVEPRDEWFVLHDAEGRAVGWLHATVVVADDGTVTAAEEYEFRQNDRRYQVTSTCTADASLQPLGCYFRERVSEPMLSLSAVPGGVVDRPDRIVGERIVDARSAGDTLVVVRADGNGRRERSYAWTAEATFPLLARVSARATGQSVDGVPMFDPATEEISRRSVGGVRRRAVTLDGEMRQVTEIVESGVNTQNSVWLDAAMRTVRREIAGPALVAVPASASTAKGKVGTATIPAALARELDGQFGLWVPNPAWRAEDQIDVGQIRLSCDAHGASIALTRIDHLEAGTGVVMAAEAVANWFRLLQPDLKVVSREHNTIRGRRAIRLIAEGSKARVPQRATVDVIPHHGQFLVLVCQAPKTAWRELAADFAFALQRVEFEPESVEPPLQGPLLQRQKRDQRRRPAARPRPSAAEPKKARELPVVRIPSDG